MLTPGSTGGAGLRTLDNGPPTPMQCSVLYFDRVTKRLRAWDVVTFQGIGSEEVRVERHLSS